MKLEIMPKRIESMWFILNNAKVNIETRDVLESEDVQALELIEILKNQLEENDKTRMRIK